MHGDDAIDALFDVFGSLRTRQWVMAAIGVVIWIFLLVAGLCIAPFAILGWVYRVGKNFSLKFRRFAADKLRPKDVVRARNPQPASDLVAQFVDYELLVVTGKETTFARNALISELAHIEQELEEHRLLCAEIRKLRVDDERPRRRDAIMSTRLRAEKRRQREQEEGTEE